MMLTDTFLQLVGNYVKDHERANNLWLEIFTKYSDPKRHYHTIDHLENIFSDLKEVRKSITDWDSVSFAVFYHDVIYKASANANEEDSAKLAVKRLTEIDFPTEKNAKVSAMILATKLHQPSEDNDTDFLTDADLAILGKTPYEYQLYSENVRKEYTIYPDFMYTPGRKKVLQHFLDMERIFKTDHFFNKYEKQARLNLANELQELQ